MLETHDALKSFTPEQLGDGEKKGGSTAHRTRRFEVLDRLKSRGSPLSAQQQNDWAWFKEAWDETMREVHDAKWGSTFAGMMQSILNDLVSGLASAVWEFMYRETKRVLSDVKISRL